MIRVACLGAGYFAHFHIDGWRRLAEAELVGVADIDPRRVENIGAPGFSDLETMLETTKPDLLDLIVPPAAQAAAIRTALAAGVKVIICQKPFCTSSAEAGAITAEAEAAGIPLIIHENFRWQPWYRTIKAALDAGRVGDLHQISFRFRTGDGQGPDAYADRQPAFRDMDRLLIRETGVHWVDTFRYLLGRPRAVYAELRQMNSVIKGEDAGIVIFDHVRDGQPVRAIFDGNRHLDHATENLRLTFGECWVEGTEGTITLAGDGSVKLRRFGQFETDTLLAARSYKGFAGDCVYALQGHVLAAMQGERAFENTAREYLEVLEIEGAIYASAKKGAKIRLKAKSA